MHKHPIAMLIEKADTAINQEDFDTVIDLYAVVTLETGDTALVLARTLVSAKASVGSSGALDRPR